LKQGVVSESDEQVVWLQGPPPADRCFRQLREPDGQIDVGARIVNRPVTAVAATRAAEPDATEMKLAVVVFRCGDTDVEASPAELCLNACDCYQDRENCTTNDFAGAR